MIKSKISNHIYREKQLKIPTVLTTSKIYTKRN